METSSVKRILILIVGIFIGILLVLGKGESTWLRDEIFVIFVSLVFMTPVLNILFEMKVPKEYIVVFGIGTALFIIYCYIFYSFNINKIVELILLTILWTCIGSIASWIVAKLEEIIPPD
jgi:ABC-type amino acid transport system permease subunit